MDQDNASPEAEGGDILDNAPTLDNEDVAPQEEIAEAPQLGDEDYELNFLGTDKFKLQRETPEEVRKALKDLEKSLNKGWTEKNMRFADERKAAQAAAEQEKADIGLQRASIKELAKLEALQEQISEYDKVDWQRWAREDPQAAWQAQIARDGLSRQHAKLDSEIKTKQDQERQSQKQQQDAWLASSAERLQSSIKDWSGDKARTIAKFSTDTYLNTNTPMDQGALQAIAWHPGLMQMAHEAMLYRQQLKSVTAAPITPPAVPVSKVGGAAPVAKDPNKMSDQEWQAWREQDLANKRRAANLRPRK